jgi:hypothetical protein
MISLSSQIPTRPDAPATFLMLPFSLREHAAAPNHVSGQHSTSTHAAGVEVAASRTGPSPIWPLPHPQPGSPSRTAPSQAHQPEEHRPTWLGVSHGPDRPPVKRRIRGPPWHGERRWWRRCLQHVRENAQTCLGLLLSA